MSPVVTAGRLLAYRELSVAALPLLAFALDLGLTRSTPGYVFTGLLDEPAQAATAGTRLAPEPIRVLAAAHFTVSSAFAKAPDLQELVANGEVAGGFEHLSATGYRISEVRKLQ